MTNYHHSEAAPKNLNDPLVRIRALKIISEVHKANMDRFDALVHALPRATQEEKYAVRYEIAKIHNLMAKEIGDLIDKAVAEITENDAEE